MYDDTQRGKDADRLMGRSLQRKQNVVIGNANEIHGALCVFILDPKLRQVLEAIDPKSVEQARRALGLV
jgi:hypothetical protein